MNKKILVTLLLTAMFGKINADCADCGPCKPLCPTDPCRRKTTSHTFFTVSPEFQAGMPERTTLWRDRTFARKDGRGGTFQLVPFGGESTRDSDLAGYFSIDFKSVLNVDENPLAPNIDILAENFNIYTQACNATDVTPPNVRGTRLTGATTSCFASQICFEPRRHVAGLGFSYRQGFARREDGRGFFFEMSFPIEEVKTSMHLGETVLQNGNGPLECATLTPPTSPSILECPLQSAVGPNDIAYSPVGSVCEAFQQPAWMYGRIDNSSSHNRKTGVADIDLLLGYDIVNTDSCYVRSYLGVLAATGNKPEGVLMFEPIVGYNRHTALRSGSQFGIEVWTHRTKKRSMWFDFQSEFFFHLSNNQVRSFDLKNKPWSRYMQVYSSPEQAFQAATTGNRFLHTPGINVFTQDVKVSPGVSRTYQTAFIFNNEGFQGELGYSFCARPAECVELQCEFPRGIALKDHGIDGGLINTVQTINDPVFCAAINLFNPNITTPPLPQSPFDLYDANTITDEDLDMNSAAHPALETYIIYASMGNRWDDREYPIFIGGGGSYEFCKDNSAMTRWLLWGKIGLSF